MTGTVHSGIMTDRDIEERRQSIATEKICDNQLTREEGWRNKAAGHPSDGDSDSNSHGNGNRGKRQALGG
jgi:hypothetical protein